MSGHTPGPWRADNNDGFSDWSIWACKPDGPRIASVSEGDEEESNARLIAAAPDLLQALVELLDDLKLRAKLEGTHVLDVSHGRYMRAEEAIAKATGGEV